jgi:hypothetical protein
MGMGVGCAGYLSIAIIMRSAASVKEFLSDQPLNRWNSMADGTVRDG